MMTAANIFISWSGARSKRVAEILRDWLPEVLQAANPWLSSDDIEKGAMWFRELSVSLSSIKIGIVCLTRDNLKAPWLLFEAGAISKALEQNRLCTYLIDLETTDVDGPLAQFQATKANKDDTKKLIDAINNSLCEGKLDEQALERAFERCWPELEVKLKETSGSVDDGELRTDRDLLAEILVLSRAIGRRLGAYSDRPMPIMELLHKLRPIEEKMLRMRLGIAEYRCYSIEEVAEAFEIPVERARRIQRAALKKLFSIPTESHSEEQIPENTSS